MSEKLEKCVQKVNTQGHNKGASYAICTANLKKKKVKVDKEKIIQEVTSTTPMASMNGDAPMLKDINPLDKSYKPVK
jgi:hypothetical protein